jgi:sporulation protein YlmC with PRC-barrel domain
MRRDNGAAIPALTVNGREPLALRFVSLNGAAPTAAHAGAKGTTMKTMKKTALMAAVAALLTSPAALSTSAFAQGAQQSVMLIHVDPGNVATGFRASKVTGSTVYNDTNESIGKVDDIIISSDGKNPYLVVSVGGFLGLGEHLVALPYDSVQIEQDKIVLPGGSKDQLKALPEFKYVSK